MPAAPHWVDPLMQTVAIAILGWTCLMWCLDYRLYRSRFRLVLQLSSHLATHSRKFGNVVVGCLMLVGSVILFALPLPYSHAFKAAVVIAIGSRIAMTFRPPGTLLLASSRSWNHKFITSALRPLTIGRKLFSH